MSDFNTFLDDLEEEERLDALLENYTTEELIAALKLRGGKLVCRKCGL